MKSLLNILKEIDMGFESTPLNNNFNSEQEMLDRIENSENIKKFIGSNIIKKLGSGSNGIAYLMSNNKVLKVTTDDEEAGTSALVKNIDHPNIIKIYDVAEWIPKRDIEVGHSRSNVKVYFIVQEKLEAGPAIENKLKDYIPDFVNEFGESLLNAAAYIGGIESKEKEIESNSNISEDARKFYLDVIEALKELKVRGIYWMDISASNIGRRKGDYVVFDLGVSVSQGKVEKKINESIFYS